MGLAVFPYVETILNGRKRVTDLYDKNLDFSSFQKIKIRESTSWNYGYYTAASQKLKYQLIRMKSALNNQNIFPRRYFYPSLSNLPYLESISMPISESVNRRILCLPLYMELSELEIRNIITIINAQA